MFFHEGNLIGLDFETYGSVPLPTVGLSNYIRDPHFTPLIARLVGRSAGRKIVGRYDIITDTRTGMANRLYQDIGDRFIVAHNAPFEKAVLDWLGLCYPADRFVDSAVVARAAGAGSKLEAAAPQLLGQDKMAVGKELIKLFSIPGVYQEMNDTQSFVTDITLAHPEEWVQFGDYCELDAEQGLDIVLNWEWVLTGDEHSYEAITLAMNETGWHVDIDLVKEMQRRYEDNMSRQLEQFRNWSGAHELNLNSLKQMKEWCAERGIKATSFDEKHVASLLRRIEKKLEQMDPSDHKYDGYYEVAELLRTKQVLGGSSLKKLEVILNNVNSDSRLTDQYLHIGASQTWRTTGRNVQMQNLKRIGDEPADMAELDDPDVEWDNDELARNIRQVFTATEDDGFTIVGDFSSVEGRGLAYLAGQADKLQAFRDGLDIYKVGASKQYNVPYDMVSKAQRQFGKVGELSCGYQAGSGAVQSFASGMGVTLTEGEAAKIVNDWREANPLIVDFWWKLDEMLHKVVDAPTMWQEIHRLPFDNLVLKISTIEAPKSLTTQVGRAMKSIEVELSQDGGVILRRFFHGVYNRGKNICYFRPSELKSGDLWKIDYVDQKTKQRRNYSIYGGKLAGILTQSFCREIFFRVLRRVERWVQAYPHIQLVGQFHDEIVLDWKPLRPPAGSSSMWLDQTKARLEDCMSDPGAIGFPSFPLAADVKHDYRYTK